MNVYDLIYVQLQLSLFRNEPVSQYSEINPLVVNRSAVVSRFLNICSISGSGNSTAQGTAIVLQLFISCWLQD